MMKQTVTFIVRQVAQDARGERVSFERLTEDRDITPGLALQAKSTTGLKPGDEVKLTLEKIVKN